MLVLSRNVGERIVIGGEIIVEVLSVDYNQKRVRIGILAPVNVTVDREEIHNLKQQEEVCQRKRSSDNPKKDGGQSWRKY